MIRLLIIILILLASLAIGPLLSEDKGYILISIWGYIYELSVYAAIFWFTTACIAILMLRALIKTGFKFSFSAWNTIAFASRRRGIANFNRALAAYMLEDYDKAEQLFAKSAIPSKRKQSAYLMAASASAKLNLKDNTNHYLSLLEKETTKVKGLDLESVIIKVKLLMNQKEEQAYQQARVLIDDHHKQIGHDNRLLALEIELCIIEERFQTAIENIAFARKDKTISDEKIQHWESQAFYGVFADIAQNKAPQELEAYWQSLARKIKHREKVRLAYIQVLAQHNILAPLSALLIPILKKSPSTEFLQSIRSLPIKQADELIALVQKQLHNNMHSAKWLSCLGHLAVNSEQWSMAERAFGSLLKLDGKQYDKIDLQALAIALANDGMHKEANDIWQRISKEYQ
ncbi:heme biosynthesis HemY N-terminal domain-containing protein [Litorilituus sediminis]|uniref:Heme biosynthesis protein HemY n=1 Tax=Litorilituus sediminis TaxID=718192 RepID=A0A4P6P9K3_9GAMM|nr:heme biosynthesis HemY N-terminal domain-containing protein [Litorilituus sediminis]QBG36217.1 heme biosynthesis protein HemY [Litorilituus sediminis]